MDRNGCGRETVSSQCWFNKEVGCKDALSTDLLNNYLCCCLYSIVKTRDILASQQTCLGHMDRLLLKGRFRILRYVYPSYCSNTEIYLSIKVNLVYIKFPYRNLSKSKEQDYVISRKPENAEVIIERQINIQ